MTKFINWIKNLFNSWKSKDIIPVDSVVNALKSADTDGSGSLSYNEIMAMIKKAYKEAKDKLK
ncbi:MAG: hypothetical protein HUJ52_03580 [Malacoplasma sp.]|nr:hypothetical protein [Malacoplasma sp.]